jgi:hypothetical protein
MIAPPPGAATRQDDGLRGQSSSPPLLDRRRRLCCLANQSYDRDRCGRGVGMQIVLYQRTGPVRGGIGSLVRTVEPGPDGETLDIGVFSPWPSSLGSDDKFLCLVPGSAGNADEWLTPTDAEVRKSFLNARSSQTVGLVSFSEKVSSRGDVPTINASGQIDEDAIARLISEKRGSWREILPDAVPQAVTSATDRRRARESAAAAPMPRMPDRAPLFTEVRSNSLMAERSLLCRLLGRRD